MSGQSVDTELMDVIDKAAEFHGHRGPFLVIGVRMGLLAKRNSRMEIQRKWKKLQQKFVLCLIEGSST